MLNTSGGKNNSVCHIILDMDPWKTVLQVNIT